ncbi:acetamidase/formamidase family protein [Evansella clarkii]|uniref:acetamidase/formamidase family protein n=1 Tax=Evansella clarkii TaxID=79879 RepID=UPI0009972D67|nr:acetamidase/formamidase family protein [Evansella clarkii]
MIHKLELRSENLQGSFSNEYKPVLTINSGDSLHLTTPDIQWGYSPSKDTERFEYNSGQNEEKRGHPVLGPVAVRGAKPGTVLEVRLNEIKPGWYGRNWAGGNKNWQNEKIGIIDEERLQVDWELDSESMTGKCKMGEKEFRVALQPFMGLLGVAPEQPGMHPTPPPRNCGGNIDCKELVTGSTLFLPVYTEGALFSIGDGHAVQGDGEISGTAIECPMDHVDVTLTVREDMKLSYPRAKTPSGWITFGFHEDLNEATGIALYEMMDLIQELYNVSRTEATALASVAVDLRITQVVNGAKGVHAVLPFGAVR